jgi:hypothetical protein
VDQGTGRTAHSNARCRHDRPAMRRSLTTGPKHSSVALYVWSMRPFVHEAPSPVIPDRASSPLGNQAFVRQNASMLLGWDALHAHDWSKLSHAYGPATDTPGHLQRLAEDNDAAWAETIDHLEGALTHQSSIYSATAPAALVAAGLLTDPLLSRPVATDRSEPVSLRAHLLSFLGTVAASTEPTWTESELRDAYHLPQNDIYNVWDSEPDAEGYKVIIQCRAICPILVTPVLQCLSDGDPHTRAAATTAAAQLAEVPTVASRQAEILARIKQQAHNADTYYERANALIWLDRLGAADTTFLIDRHPGIRLIATFTSSLANHPDAASVVRDAVTDPAQAAEWYSDSRERLFTEGWPNHLLHEAVRRIPNFNDLLPTALVVAATTPHPTMYEDLGLLLETAFPKPFSPADSLNHAQRTFLQALLDNSSLWESEPPKTSRELDTSLFLVGLPSDHRSLSAIVNPAD